MGDALVGGGLGLPLFCLCIVEHVLLHEAGIGEMREGVISFIVHGNDTVNPYVYRCCCKAMEGKKRDAIGYFGAHTGKGGEGIVERFIRQVMEGR